MDGKSTQEAAYVGLGRTKFLQLVDDGRMPKGGTVDKCRIWDRYQLDEAFEALMSEPDHPSAPPGFPPWSVFR